jgi:hypothetical protein
MIRSRSSLGMSENLLVSMGLPLLQRPRSPLRHNVYFRDYPTMRDRRCQSVLHSSSSAETNTTDAIPVLPYHGFDERIAARTGPDRRASRR